MKMKIWYMSSASAKVGLYREKRRTVPSVSLMVETNFRQMIIRITRLGLGMTQYRAEMPCSKPEDYDVND